MVYDPVNDQVLLFGGLIYSNGRETRYNDLWSYDVTSGTWREITSGTRPTSRNGFDMVYLEGRNQILLYGGDTNMGKSDETWIYDLTEDRWFCINSELSIKPPRLSEITLAYDTGNDVVVLFGGMGENAPNSRDLTYNELWVLTFEPFNWVQMSPENNPLPQYGASMIYDQVSSTLLMYPGHWNQIDDPTIHGYGDNVWRYQYQTDTWDEFEASSKPVGRYWANVRSVGSGKLVLFGGNRATSMDDTWVYDIPSNTWNQINSVTTPPDRMCSSMAYDSKNNVLVMFGGFQEGMAFLDDTWILDLETNTWERAVAGTTDDTTEPTPANQSIPSFPVEAILIVLILLTCACRRDWRVYYRPKESGR